MPDTAHNSTAQTRRSPGSRQHGIAPAARWLPRSGPSARIAEPSNCGVKGVLRVPPAGPRLAASLLAGPGRAAGLRAERDRPLWERSVGHRCLSVHRGLGPSCGRAGARSASRHRSAARSLSLTTKAANSAWVMCMGSASCWMSHSENSAVVRAFDMSVASLLTISGGVRAGAQIPYQIGSRSRQLRPPRAAARPAGGVTGARC